MCNKLHSPSLLVCSSMMAGKRMAQTESLFKRNIHLRILVHATINGLYFLRIIFIKTQINHTILGGDKNIMLKATPMDAGARI